MLKQATFCAILSAVPVVGYAQQPLLNCSVKPSEIIEISSVIGGVVAEVLVNRGQTVAEGDPSRTACTLWIP